MELQETFDSAAELYDRARPGYPPRLYVDLLLDTGLQPGARALEIGPGTGQATRQMARAGFAVTAVELGANLAAVARRNLAPYPACSVEVARFEEWPLPAEPFEIVYSATAFHWLDPATRLAKCRAALRPGGWLAVWDSWHCAGGSAQFFIDVQECYEHWDPATPPGLRLTEADLLASNVAQVTTADGFEQPIHHRYRWEQTYTTESYLDVLRTYSGHIAMDDGAREGLLSCIGDLIESRYGGEIRKAYVTRLTLARRDR
jgi:SAM-dependent methyltransferase